MVALGLGLGVPFKQGPAGEAPPPPSGGVLLLTTSDKLLLTDGTSRLKLASSS